MNLALTMLLLSQQNLVSEDRLKQTLEYLATFPTRNTNTEHLTNAAKGIADEFSKIPGLQVELMEYDVKKGRRIVEDKRVVQVVATLPGETTKRVMIGAHLDTINLSGDPLTAIAPGINDDGSGVAVTLECARIMSQKKWKNTLVFIAFSGEEQGLFGSAALADRAIAEKWDIEALLNNDTVGSSVGGTLADKKRIRLYSEESETHNSRELARWIEWVSRDKVTDLSPWLVFRKDRFQRGGDHTPFNQRGFNAIRFIEALEALDRQHTKNDTIDGIDFKYLANVARLNLVTMTALANCGNAPKDVKMDARQAYNTTLRWKGEPGVQYRVYWRETSSSVWQGSALVGEVSEYTVTNKNKDDHFFAVGAENGVPVSAE